MRKEHTWEQIKRRRKIKRAVLLTALVILALALIYGQTFLIAVNFKIAR